MIVYLYEKSNNRDTIARYFKISLAVMKKLSAISFGINSNMKNKSVV